MNEHTGLWLYAVADDLPSGPLASPGGVEAGQVEAVVHDGLAAVVSPVDLETYGEQALARRLEDLDWLAETARHHHAVIEAVHHLGTTIPMRPGTVYDSRDQVVRLLTERHDLLRRVLDSVSGHTEWGVRAYATPANPPPVAAETAEAEASRLRDRRDEDTGRDAVHQEVWDAAQRVFHELGLLSAAQRRHRPEDAEPSERSKPVLLNGSFLVEDEEQDTFTKAMSTLAVDNPQLELQLSGPWPPYSFVGLAVDS